ncbi:glycosyltransferase family 2 protein [Sphingobacterium haloxyli]|uniref:Glycosyltransferase family 2 protein n=1 Tax=Sphingobacterium haloxyli TaxID=2100533 RepID=A0A2S9J617_9SPHI|nr:glycosyltransferase family 2 protein [Sphingobacterium haloxyli]PRD48207.1 glycosyltransferase family 2 protein [Sphingobacterium haloxyli]
MNMGDVFPLISVIIPNYNHEAFLEQRIDAVLNQTFQDFEIILLDDKSTDESAKVIARYSDHRKVKHIVYNSENSGSTFRQWKQGLEFARGSWIWIAESDDVTDPRFLSTLLQGIKQDEDIVLAYCASHKINEHGHIFDKVDWAETVSNRDWSRDFCNVGIAEITQQLFYKNTIPNASAVLFKKSAVNMAIFDEISRMRFAGDWYFWIKLLEKGKVFFSAQFLNQFREHRFTTRTMKPAVIEKSRFEEYFKVLNYCRSRYRLSWDVKKHIWIIDEWVDKYFRFSSFSCYNTCFPVHYNVLAGLKILKNRWFGPLKRTGNK